MEGALFVNLQMQWINDMQNALRSPGMDAFFKFFANYIDTGLTYSVAILLIWYLLDRKIGIRLGYLFLCSLAMTILLKYWIDLPRPCQLDPDVKILCLRSPGFPSASAQIAAIIFGVALIECKKNLYRWLALGFALLVSFSRIYLGVHYFTDILGGWAVGALLVFAYAKFFPLFDKKWKIAALAFPFVFLILGWIFPQASKHSVDLFFAVLGLGIGLIVADRVGRMAINRRQLASVFAGLIGLFVAYLFFPGLLILWAFLLGFWISFLGAYLVRKR